MQEFIRAAGTKGFRKSAVEVNVRSPTGQRRQVLWAEVQSVARDLRRRKRSDYVTLMSLSQDPRCDLTYNVATHRFSLVVHLGPHFGFVVLDELKEAAFAAVLYTIVSRSRGFSSNLLEGLKGELPVITKYFIEKFEKQIKAARRTWFKSAKAHRRQRS